MAALVSPPAPQLYVPPPEQRMVIYGVRWRDYVNLREALDTPGLRMTFCEGTLELMSPSRLHELWKTSIARLLELYALERDLPLVGYGSTTFRLEAKERGAEPDECYRVGTLMKDGEMPDIVLEVIYTSPTLDKLHVYEGFAVPEVWRHPSARPGRLRARRAKHVLARPRLLDHREARDARRSAPGVA